MTKHPTLLHCPMCGAGAKYYYEDNAQSVGVGVICVNMLCLISTPIRENEEKAAIAWNKRVAE